MTKTFSDWPILSYDDERETYGQLIHSIYLLFPFFICFTGKKKGGFANTLRKRFSRGPKNKQRSQSADRAGTLGRGEVLLHVPGDAPIYASNKTTGKQCLITMLRVYNIVDSLLIVVQVKNSSLLCLNILYYDF